MRSLRALRALLRIELRQLRHNPARALLVVALVTIPVAVLAGGSAVLSTTQATLTERRTSAMGQAELLVELPAGTDPSGVLGDLPPDARTAVRSAAVVEVVGASRRLRAHRWSFSAGALDPGGSAAGMLIVRDGAFPRESGDVAVSTLVAQACGLSPGDVVDVDGVTRRVAGIVDRPEDLDASVVLTAPGGGPAAGSLTALVDLEDGAADAAAEQLRGRGLAVRTRAEVQGADGFEALAVFVVGGFGFVEAALVIAAAFAVSLRRRQRELGLVEATGAAPRAVRRAIVGSALGLAGVGVALGMALGLGTAMALVPFLDGWNQRINGPLELSPVHLLGAALLGPVAAWIAVAIPVRAAARLPVLVALSGRRPVAAGGGRLAVAAVVLTLVGAAAVLGGSLDSERRGGAVLLAGSSAVLVGLGLGSPLLLALAARFAGALPPSLRLAVRDAGRFRARNGPVVAAVLAGLASTVLLGSIVASVEQLVGGGRAAWRADQLVLDGPGAEPLADELARAAEVRARAPLAAVYRGAVPLRATLVAGSGEGARTVLDGWVAWGGPELLAACGAEGGSEDLERGALVALVGADELEPGVDLRLQLEPASGLSAADAPLSAIRVAGPARVPLFVLSSSTAERLGLRSGPPPGRGLSPVLLRLGAAIDGRTLGRAAALAEAHPATTVDAAPLHRRAARSAITGLLAATLVAGLSIVFVATALSAAESANDAQTLVTLGAAPGVLRRHLAARAGWLAAVGGCLAVPAGLLPAAGLVRTASVSLEFALPWREIAVAVLVLPLAAWAGAWLVAAVRPARPHAARRRD